MTEAEVIEEYAPPNWTEAEQVEIRAKYAAALTALYDQIEPWLHEADWVTRRERKHMEGGSLGEYEVPALLMQSLFTRAIIEPVGLSGVGHKPLADLYIMPGSEDWALFYHNESGWHLHRDMDDPSPAHSTINDETSPLVTRESLLTTLAAMKRYVEHP